MFIFVFERMCGSSEEPTTQILLVREESEEAAEKRILEKFPFDWGLRLLQILSDEPGPGIIGTVELS